MREQFGDCLDDTLDDPLTERVELLPWEITEATGANNVKVVLSWLGQPPIAAERINVKNPDKLDRTLLVEAAYEQHTGLMSFLLQEGADVDPTNAFGKTPSRQACSLALEKAIRILLEWVADKDLREPTSPQEYVSRAGNKSLAKLLESPLGGRRCEIFGLKNRFDLNGKACIVNRYLPEMDRYEVKVERTGEEARVKSVNLKRCDRTRIDCGGFMFT